MVQLSENQTRLFSVWDVPGVSSHLNKKKRNVVVFDIDGTLCFNDTFEDGITFSDLRMHSDCKIIKEGDQFYVFKPHLKVLFDYLLSKSVRIVFFSAGGKMRNLSLMCSLFEAFYHFEFFFNNKFAVYGMDSIVKQKQGESVTHIKDLAVVLKQGETLQDVILVDDRLSVRAGGAARHRPHGTAQLRRSAEIQVSKFERNVFQERHVLFAGSFRDIF